MILIIELLVDWLLEVIICTVMEALSSAGLRRFLRSRLTTRRLRPVTAGIGYILLGGLIGFVSVGLIPEFFIRSEGARAVALLTVPFAVGFGMAAIGAWRRKRDLAVIRLDSFAYGTICAYAMMSVRMVMAS